MAQDHDTSYMSKLQSPLLYVHVVVNAQIELGCVENDAYVFNSSDLIFDSYFHPSTSDLLTGLNVRNISQLEYVFVQR